MVAVGGAWATNVPPAVAGAPLSPVARNETQAVAAQISTNAAYSVDHIQPSWGSVNRGSNSTGKPSSASSDAKFESANRRYGTTAWKRRQYHACSSGVVVDSRKYGSPIVAVSSSRIRAIGASSPRGFHSGEARIGSSSSEAASSPT